jgi:hypothetical protein
LTFLLSYQIEQKSNFCVIVKVYSSKRKEDSSMSKLFGAFSAVKAFAQSLSATNPVVDTTAPAAPAAVPAKRTMVFVFGSNEAGIHGAGAAKCALDEHGAILGQGVGRQGDSYAIPTKGHYIKPGETQKRIGRTLPLIDIEKYVDEFIAWHWR